ncbi:MAG: hypothetical protein HUJ86_07985, partial [Synergistes sp.]|nr:hypothetical protein [Synergistes sp.]
ASGDRGGVGEAGGEADGWAERAPGNGGDGGNGGNADATVKGNSLTIICTAVGESVYGGYAYSAGGIGGTGGKGGKGGSYCGEDGSNGANGSATASANDNTINILGSSTIKGSVYGGYAEAAGSGSVSASATGNTINWYGGEIGGTLYGGYANNAESKSGNTLNLYAKNREIASLGGFENYNLQIPIDFNTEKDIMLTIGKGASLDMGGTSFTVSKEFGGEMWNGGETVGLISGDLSNTPSGNITIKEGIATSYDATLSYNQTNKELTAKINNAEVLPVDIYGTASKDKYAYSVGDGAITGDAASSGAEYTIPSMSVLQARSVRNAYGGYSDSDGTSVTNNKITVSEDSVPVDEKLYGGYASGSNSDVKNNEVKINRGTAGGVYGGYTENSGNAVTNTVTIEESTIALGVVGGYTPSGNANANTVNIINAKISEDIYGGRTLSGEGSNNTVNITGNSKINGGITGGSSENGNASYNVINIGGGQTDGNVYGGHAIYGDASGNVINIGKNAAINGDVYGGRTSEGDVTGNVINVLGGTINGNVYGGSTENGKAENNIVNWISGEINGDLFGNAPNDTGSANTLNMYASNKTVKSLGGFQDYNFTVPADFTSDKDVMMKAESLLDMKGSRVNVAKIYGGEKKELKVGDKISLIKIIGASLLNPPTRKNILIKEESIAAIRYIWGTLWAEDRELLVTPKNEPDFMPKEDDKSYSEGIAAALVTIKTANDLIAERGMEAAKETSTLPLGFGAFRYGGYRTETGSHI